MKLIAFASQSTALLLANYLRRQGIQVNVEAGSRGDEFVISLVDESQFESARQIAETFIREPRHPRYQDAAWEVSENVNLQSSMRLGGVSLKDIKSMPLTFLVLVICVLVYIGSIFTGYGAFTQSFMIMPLSNLLESGQWWRLVSPAFIHFSALHIVFNLLWWWILGGPIERKFGTSFLLVFLIITAVLSNVAQLLVTGPNFGGLSGVVYALMGFVWWVGWLKPSWGLSLPKPLVGFMLVWLVLGYADILWVSMANTAHTAGLISGCLMALALIKVTPQKPT